MELGSGSPSHRAFVHRFISWERIEERLEHFPVIASHYPLSVLRAHANTAPYFCHYMAWRLSDLQTATISNFERLLSQAAGLLNWDAEFRQFRSDGEFARYWDLTWQLQVADLLVRLGYEVEWTRKGPDLVATREGTKLFVECHTFHKSFGIELFIEELLRRIDPALRVSHQWYLRSSLPKNSETAAFLDSVFRPIVAPEFLTEKKAEAAISYPVLLWGPTDTTNLVVYLEGEDPDRYVPGRLPLGAGDPKCYLHRILSEALSNKGDANHLAGSRPNLLLVNYLLSAEGQLAIGRAEAFGEVLGPVHLPAALDAMGFGAVGIDSALMPSALRLWAWPDHPAVTWGCVRTDAAV